ncbi:MAG: hypothetical protein PHW99_01125 [Rhodoferax sp.]|nr:hypothetical protein [Rhodoferax sp.]
MVPQGDKLSQLFKSLQPDQSQLEAVKVAAVQEAQQRWPMFKELAPVRPADTPELSDVEKSHWHAHADATAARPKPALTVPGLNDRLAESLNNFATRKPVSKEPALPAQTAPNASARPLFNAATSQPAPVLAPQRVSAAEVEETTTQAPAARPVMPTMPAEAPVSHTPTPVAEASGVPAVPAPAVRVPPWARTPEKLPAPVVEETPVATPPTPPTRAVEPPPAAQAETLQNLFKRLEGPEKTPAKPTASRPSFLGRMAKR